MKHINTARHSSTQIPWNCCTSFLDYECVQSIWNNIQNEILDIMKVNIAIDIKNIDKNKFGIRIILVHFSMHKTEYTDNGIISDLTNGNVLIV